MEYHIRQKNEPFERVHISVFLFAAIAYGVTSSLGFYSSDVISMNVGDEALNLLNFVIFWVSILIQPWVLLGLWLEAVTGQYILHTGRISSALTGLGSAILMFSSFWFIVRNRPRLLWSVVVLWIVLTGLHLLDLKHTSSIIAETGILYLSAP